MSFSTHQIIKHDLYKLPLSPDTKTKIISAISGAKKIGGGRIGDLTLRHTLCDVLGSNTGMEMYHQLVGMKSQGTTKRPGLIAGLFGFGKK